MTIAELLQRIGASIPEPPTPCPELAAGARPDAPRCRRCGQLPEQFEEYREAAADEYEVELADVTDEMCRRYVRAGEGTYNARTGGFYCTGCYIAIGQPNGKAP